MNRIKEIDIVISLSISVIVLLAGLLIGKTFDLLQIRDVLISVIATSIFFFLLLTVVLYFVKNKQSVEFEYYLNQLKTFSPQFEFEWLLNDLQLSKVESNCIGDEVWIISPDLSNVVDKSVISETVKSNCLKGVTYTYIVPKTETIYAMLPLLKKLFNDKGRLKLIMLSEEKFRFISPTHIAIFNPNRINGAPSEVFFELPIENLKEKKIRGFWVKVSRDASISFIGRFRTVIEES